MKHKPFQNVDGDLARKLGGTVLLTILFGALGYIIIMLLFYAFSYNVYGEQKWNLFDGFIGVVTLSLLIGGLVYTVGDRISADIAEEREKAKLSYEIYQAIFDKLTDPEQEAARRWIINNIAPLGPGEDTGDWFRNTQARIMAGEGGQEVSLPEGQRSVKMTLNCLDYIGFIVKNYWDVKDDALDWLSLPVAKIWRILEPYVLEIRRQRNASDYYAYAEHIGMLCIKRRQSRGLPDENISPHTL